MYFLWIKVAQIRLYSITFKIVIRVVRLRTLLLDLQRNYFFLISTGNAVLVYDFEGRKWRLSEKVVMWGLIGLRSVYEGQVRNASLIGEQSYLLTLYEWFTNNLLFLVVYEKTSCRRVCDDQACCQTKSCLRSFGRVDWSLELYWNC